MIYEIDIINEIKEYMILRGIYKYDNCLYIGSNDLNFLSEIFGYDNRKIDLNKLFEVQYICARNTTDSGNSEIVFWYGDEKIYTLLYIQIELYTNTSLYHPKYLPSSINSFNELRPFFFDTWYPDFNKFLSIGLQISEINSCESLFK